MRRVELINGVREILKAIEDSGLELVMSAFRERLRRPEGADSDMTSAILNSLKEYTILANNFSHTTQKVTKILKLDKLEDSKIWAELINPNEPGVFLEVSANVRFALTHLPKIMELVQQQTLESNDDDKNLFTRDGSKDLDILSVIVIEDTKRFSTPSRLIEVLEAITDLYEACATMQKASTSSLSVIACDSGSDKSFDFLGLAKVIECVKEIILSMWDRVVFFREKQFSQRIQLIAESLPIIEQISVLERSESLSPEQGELLRRKIISGAHKFIEAGGTIPEIETKSHFNPRLLLAPQPKLLVEAPLESGSGPEVARIGEIGDSNIGFDDLSDAEKLEVARLLAKAKERKNQVEAERDDQQ